MSLPALAFDREVTLAELLKLVPEENLQTALCGTVPGAWWVVDCSGQVLRQRRGEPVLDTLPDGTVKAPIRCGIDTLGHLHALPAAAGQVAMAKPWLELVLRDAHLYRMAADVHLHAINADYEALQRKHEALQQSETRYRELSAQLEQRVAAQVTTIENTQRQLYQSEKLASVGSLAAGMAHEINNPIGFLSSNLGTAQGYVEQLGETLQAFVRGDPQTANRLYKDQDLAFVLEDFSSLLDESVQGASRVAAIVSKLKTYADIDHDGATATDINEAIHAVVSVISPQIPPGVQIELNLQPLPPFTCAQGQINQALFSLLENARLAVGAHGALQVSSRVVDGAVCISITDNGCGIAPELQGRVFDPFFTTRAVGQGMGLGLTVCRDIVRAHQGSIELRSTPGAGSTFTIRLPLPAPGGSTTP